jgi:Zn-dependent protease
MFSILIWLIALTIAITIHEFSHAFVADRLGDPTPRLLGRLTLNPIRHYDPVGTTMLLVTSLLRSLGWGIMPFGWAKPVQFDPFNLENPRRDAALISLAGPASNFTLALALSVLLRLVPVSDPNLLLFANIIIPIILLNVVLGVFNLIPVHPLDGGKILVGFLPKNLAVLAESLLNRYGFLILLLLIIPVNGNSAFSIITGPFISWLLRLLLPLQLISL